MGGGKKKKKKSATYISFAISSCFSAIVCSLLFGIEAAAILAAYKHAGTPNCWHAGMLVDGQPAREGPQGCWSVCAAGVHPIACRHPQLWHAGMQACWPIASQRGREARMLVCLCCWGSL